MLRKFIPKTLFTKISVVLILSGISLPLFTDVFPDQVKKCGLITQKMVIPKGRSEAELVFGMQFPNDFQAVNVSKTTYMRYQVGDNVCFTLPAEMSLSEGFIMFYVVLAWIVLFLYVLCSIIYLDDE